MTLLLLLISLLYLATDSLAWRYYQTGPIMFGELSKVALILLVGVTAYTAVRWVQKGRRKGWIIAGICWHFVIQQVGCGLIRQGNPLYLGAGWFDVPLKWIVGDGGGGTIYYILILLAVAGVGVHQAWIASR